MTSPLSPEAVAQMVAELRAENLPASEAVADMLTTLAAENATLRAERDALDAKLDDAETELGRVIMSLPTDRGMRLAGAVEGTKMLRASEAAALERLRVMADAVGELGDDLTYFPELTKHNLHQRAYDIALADLTPTADKE